MITWILHELEASIGKALKGEVVVYYYEPLITQHMGASGSPSGWKEMRNKKDYHPIYFLNKMYCAIFLCEPAVIK